MMKRILLLSLSLILLPVLPAFTQDQSAPAAQAKRMVGMVPHLTRELQARMAAVAGKS